MKIKDIQLLSIGQVEEPLDKKSTVEIDGLAAGVFEPMYGGSVEIKKEDLAVWVANTNEALESTATKSGRLQGFPIDTLNHDHGIAAAWIKGVRLHESGEKVVLACTFTEKGRQLITEELVAYFSPSIDTEAKVIYGGSLTNYPASRTRTHKIQLTPVELSSGEAFGLRYEELTPSWASQLIEAVGELLGLHKSVTDSAQPGADQDNGEPDSDDQAADKIQLEVKSMATLKDLMSTDEGRQELSAYVQSQIESDRSQRERRAKIESLSGDIAELQLGDGFSEFAQALDDQQFAYIEAMISRVKTQRSADKADRFDELGHDKAMTTRLELPEFYAAQLESGQLSIADLSNPLFKADIGDLSQYDLSKWKDGGK